MSMDQVNQSDDNSPSPDLKLSGRQEPQLSFDTLIPPKPKSVNNHQGIHQKQLSADSTSARMKYNFNSCPNLRPKSASISRSSPGTPNLSASGRRRRPPPAPPVPLAPPQLAATFIKNADFDDDDGIEVKTLSSPNLISRWSFDLDVSDRPPVPKPRHKRRTNQTLKTAQSSSTDLSNEAPVPINSSRPAMGKPRRVPPLPPITTKNSSFSDDTDGHTTITLGMHEVAPDRKQATPEPVQGVEKSSNRSISPGPHSKSVRAHGLLFTPPPSRSHSLKRLTSGKHNKSSEIAEKPNTLTPALSKPLPPLPSLSKPLPPLPSSNLAPSPITDSDYAYIPDSLGRCSPSFNIPPTHEQGHTRHVTTPPQFEEYVQMSNNSLSQDGGYSDEDGYMPMSAIAPDDNPVSLANVFGEDSAGYIAMLPSQSMADEVVNECMMMEDEYVQMSGSMDEGSTNYSKVQRSCEKSSTLPSAVNRTEEHIFGYNSMYIDLDMIKPIIQQDNEAKHPKSRFSISASSETSPPPDQPKYGRSLDHSPRHNAQTITASMGSKLTPVTDIDELDNGLYATIPDYVYSKK